MDPSASQTPEVRHTRSPLRDLANDAIKLLMLTLLAACIALLLFRFYFPGYLAPLLIWHEDHYIYIGMSAQAYGFGRYFTSYPRPFAHVFIELCGRLGTQGVLAPVFGLAFLNAALVVLYVQRTLGRLPSFLAIATYFVLVFANPQFYWSIKEDPFAVPSFTCLILAFHCWQTFVDRRNRWAFAGVIVLGCAMVQFKESYVPSLAVFLIAFALFEKRYRLAALAALAILGAVTAASFIHTSHAWKLFHEGQLATDPYYSSFAPKSVARGLKLFLSRLIAPLPILAVFAGIAWAYKKDKAIFLSCLVSLTCGVAALLANATLPNHFLDQYAGLGAFLLYAPFLFFTDLLRDVMLRRQSAAIAAAMLICCAAMYEYRPKPNSRARQLLSFEATSRNMLASLSVLKKNTGLESNSLVVGMNMEFYPFRTPSFMLKEMGLGRLWTVIVPDSTPEVADATTRLVHRDNFQRLQGEPYERVFVYASDGRLMGNFDSKDSAALTNAKIADTVAPEIVSHLRLVAPQNHARPNALYAIPDPIRLGPGDEDQLGQTVVYWIAPGIDRTEIHLNREDGPVFAAGGSVGMAATNRWVTKDIKFFLEDAASHRVLKTMQVRLVKTPGVR